MLEKMTETPEEVFFKYSADCAFELFKLGRMSEEDYEKIDSNKQAILLNQLPKFLRRIFFWRPIERNPFFRKKYAGTVLVTALGMAGKKIAGWAMHPTSNSPVFTIGAIKEKPCVVNKKIVIREILYLSLMIDHSVIDGAPAVRFVARLIEILEDAIKELKEK